jgi:hypothetical protein
MSKIIAIITATILLFGCSSRTTTNSDLNEPTNYCFEKECVITGKLSAQDFYGPPNFGDTPEIDKLEHCYLITLDPAIDIISSDTINGYNTEDKYGQSCFQIVGYDTKVNGHLVSYDSQYLKNIPIGTVISLKGHFDSATTGHHHTEVLFVVDHDYVPLLEGL